MKSFYNKSILIKFIENLIKQFVEFKKFRYIVYIVDAI